jgi:hypothetical protein
MSPSSWLGVAREYELVMINHARLRFDQLFIRWRQSGCTVGRMLSCWRLPGNVQPIRTDQRPAGACRASARKSREGNQNGRSDPRGREPDRFIW